jgi:hypothetical protein
MYSVHIDAQKRRNKDLARLMEQQDESKNKVNHKITRYRKALMKKVVVAILALIIVWKLWMYINYTEPPAEVPPQQKVQTVSKWVYEDHKQGLTETGLKQVLSAINNGEKIDSGRSVHDQEKETINKVEKPYTSTGSLTFKGGKFYLDGNVFRILSGAMHYFRVMPEYWQDRMRKMKACGLNTLET